jgi:hypothetical protein
MNVVFKIFLFFTESGKLHFLLLFLTVALLLPPLVLLFVVDKVLYPVLVYPDVVGQDLELGEAVMLHHPL